MLLSSCFDISMISYERLLVKFFASTFIDAKNDASLHILGKQPHTFYKKRLREAQFFKKVYKEEKPLAIILVLVYNISVKNERARAMRMWQKGKPYENHHR
jgi:hypothetical protein